MSVVDDFLTELRARKTPAAAWHKIDLHNHSPASADFRGDKSTALDDFAAEIRAKRLSVVAFTDHDRLPEPEFVAELAKRTGALILDGLELNVFVDAFEKPEGKIDKNICFHLLICFDPDAQSPPTYWVQHLFQQCRVETRTFGDRTLRGVANSLDDISEILKPSGAILVPAHLHSGHDAFRTRSVDKIFDDSQFLRWSREIFTALDVRSDKTAAFFDGRHQETDNLEISCIRSSDAHTAVEIGTLPTWVQMERISFAELRAALELPGRVSRDEPSIPASYIEGIHVDGQFLKDFWLTFSPHLNVLIGVKGSGKTSLLECVRFCLGTEVPAERLDAVTQHLKSILGPAGKVRLLLKRDDGARIVVERRISDQLFQITFDDDRTLSVKTPDSFRFAAAILGWHEIEHAATDRQIRRLHMDAISGREEVRRLTDEATQDVLAILRLHEQAAAKYNEFSQLAKTVEQQNAMRLGLQQLKDANLIELRDRMSSALADKSELLRLRDHLRSLPPVIPERAAAVLRTDQFIFESDSPLRAETSRAQADLAELKQLVATFDVAVGALCTGKAESAETLLIEATRGFNEFSDEYAKRLGEFTPEVQRLLESHRDVLEKTKSLPSLESHLAVLKEDIEASLAELAEICERVATTLDQRLALRVEKILAFNEQLVEAGVRLQVKPGTALVDEYSVALDQYGSAKETYQALRAAHGLTYRFHRMLARAYTSLREDLAGGFHVFFSRAEFGLLITILENDDLDIRFAVGKPGEEFSPIDQLSAGQRCTAVFPILLKLRDGPLFVDQPEDNLDNRHIAKHVAGVLATDKRTRQILMTSHNANLVVLSDPECIATFEVEQGSGVVSCAGFLSHRDSRITSHVLDILDGGHRALELRSKKYGRQAS